MENNRFPQSDERDKAGANTEDQRFRRSDRLRKRLEFNAVYARRCRASDQFLIVYAIPNGRATSRLGMSVSRRFGRAVFRNRWKRMMRETFRTNRSNLPSGFDFVVIPMPDTAIPSIDDLRRSLCTLTRRAAARS